MMETQANSTCEVPLPGSPHVWRLRFYHEGTERVRILRRGEVLVVGSGEGADLCLADPTVSTSHCRLSADESGLQVHDLGSKNGTFVGAGRVHDAELRGPTASFSIGRTSVVAEVRERAPQEDSLGLLGESEPMLRVRKSIHRLAALRGAVLIQGESGTGKDLVARALHQESKRRGAYVPLNVAAMPESLLDAELFGHERGAFTGAVGKRAGMFELAEDGTLFLDEIADMSLSGQAKLLRVVEDGKVRALGSQGERQVDVRLVSATCAPLAQRIEEGRFRHDLFHRLSTLVIDLPPLRKRTSDIPLLATSYLARIEPEVGRKHLLPSTLDALKRCSWPGNVRELFGVLYRAAALSSGDTLLPGHLQISSGGERKAPQLKPERALELLDIHKTVSAAARAAGVPRTTFRSVLERDSRKRAASLSSSS